MTRLLLPILIPAVAGLLALCLPAKARGWRATIGIAGTLATAALAIALIGVRETVRITGFDIGPLPLDLVLRADGFSSWAVAFTSLMALLCALYSVGWYRDRGGAPGRHDAWILLATAGAAAVLLADGMILLLVGWELVTLSLFMLVITGRPEGSEGAAKAFVMLGLGDLALLIGVVLIALANAGNPHPFDLAVLRESPMSTGSTAGVAAWLCLFTAAIAKAGAMPMHSWIPTMSTRTNAVVMAFLPGSLDKVLGIYLLARISLEWFETTAALRSIVMLIGAVTMLGAVFMALIQRDLRRLLSFQAISQVGYMLIGIGTGTIIGVLGALFHMLNHAIYKACLFLGAGQIERETGTMDLGRLGGLARTFPVTFGCTLVAALAMSGVPPFSGFASKWLIYQGCIAGGYPILLIAALFGSVLTLAAFVKVAHSVFFGPRPATVDGAAEEEGLGMRMPMVVLAILCVVLGVLPAIPLDHLIGPAALLPSGGELTGSAALAGDPATWAPVAAATDAQPTVHAFAPSSFRPGVVAALLVLGTIVALFLGSLGHPRKRRVRSVFIGGELLDRNLNRFPGTEFYETVREVGGIGRLLEAGERGRLDPYEVVLRGGRPVVAFLRRLHNGRCTDYLVWSLLGTTVLLAVLVLRR